MCLILPFNNHNGYCSEHSILSTVIDIPYTLPHLLSNTGHILVSPSYRLANWLVEIK